MNNPRSPNHHLIGHPRARGQLLTPALVLDLERLETNIAKMAEWSEQAGVPLRPHAKTHKSVQIARRQAEQGAIGFCCATLGEAEALVDAGLGEVLLTAPISSRAKAAWAARLASRSGLAFTVDNARACVWLAAAAGEASVEFPVLVDLDLGSDRTGVTDTETAAVLARNVADTPGLILRGVQAYAAHTQHIADPKLRAQFNDEALDKLRRFLKELHSAGLDPEVVTGSGTGCFERDAASGLYTDLQVGSYVFMDTEYHAVRHADGPGATPRPVFQSSLFVAASVSSHRAGAVLVDAGQKAVFRGGPNPRIADAGLPGAVYEFAGDEHGRVSLSSCPTPALGEVLEIEVPHCDPTVALHNWYHVVRGSELIDIWPVDARGV